MPSQLRLYDLALPSAFVAGAAWLATNAANVWYYAGAGALSIVAAILMYVSYGTSAWIIKLHDEFQDDKAKWTSVRNMRKVGRNMPCPYPDAYYAVAFSAELAPGQVRDVTVCGHNLIVFRPAASAAKPWPAPAVLDAYCSHLGAHLALGGGLVEGDCVRCPFHGWCFDTAGKLTRMPTPDPLPKGADLRSWPCVERNGVIAVWMSSTIHNTQGPSNAGVKVTAAAASAACAAHDSAVAATADAAAAALAGKGAAATAAAAAAAAADGGALNVVPAFPENKPWFDLPFIANVNPLAGSRGSADDAPFTFHGFSENIVNAVLFEIPENGSDICHLHILHKEFIIPALSPWLSHRWDASWVKDDSVPHIANIQVEEQICAFEFPLPGLVKVQITQAGPSQVFLQMDTPVGRIVIVETVTPVAPQRLRVLHALYAAPSVPRFIAKIILYATVVQFNKDVPVWCSKTYEPRPALVKSDKAIPAYRAWIRQFWNEKSITFEQAVRNHVRDTLGFPADAKLDW